MCIYMPDKKAEGNRTLHIYPVGRSKKSSGVRARIFFSFRRCHHCATSGTVARSEASSLGVQAAPSSIRTSGIFFRADFCHENISTAILPHADLRRAVASYWRKNVH